MSYLYRIEEGSSLFYGRSALPMDREKLRRTLCKIYAAEWARPRGGRKVEAELERNNMACLRYVGGDGKTLSSQRIKYYTCRQTERSGLPWYSCPAAMADADLSGAGLSGAARAELICLIFWERQESGNSSPTWYCIFHPEDVGSGWNAEMNREKQEVRRYRINFSRKTAPGAEGYVGDDKDRTEMKKLSTGTAHVAKEIFNDD